MDLGILEQELCPEICLQIRLMALLPVVMVVMNGLGLVVDLLMSMLVGAVMALFMTTVTGGTR